MSYSFLKSDYKDLFLNNSKKPHDDRPKGKITLKEGKSIKRHDKSLKKVIE